MSRKPDRRDATMLAMLLEVADPDESQRIADRLAAIAIDDVGEPAMLMGVALFIAEMLDETNRAVPRPLPAGTPPDTTEVFFGLVRSLLLIVRQKEPQP